MISRHPAGMPYEHIQQEINAPIITGRFETVFACSCFLVFTGIGSSVISAIPGTRMQHLNPVLKNLYINAPFITGACAQIPMSRAIQYGGGKKSVLILHGITLAGIASFTVLSAVTDITKIDHFDWRYGILLISSGMAGCASGNFPLMLHVLNWARSAENLPTIQGVFASIVDASIVMTPLVSFWMQPLGFPSIFGLYTALLATAGALGVYWLQPTPFDQFRKKLSPAAAKREAIKYGQIPFTIKIQPHKTIRELLRENFNTLITVDAAVLSFAFFVCLGNFFVTGTVLPNLLVQGYGISTQNAVYIAALSNALAILARTGSGWAISHWDKKTGGINIFSFGLSMSVLTTLPLVFQQSPAWLQYVSPPLANISYNIALMAPLNLAIKWSKRKNPIVTIEEQYLLSTHWSKSRLETQQTIDAYDVSVMFGLLNTIANLSGIVLPLILGGMVSVSEERGNQNYFGLTMALSITALIATYALHIKRQQGKMPFSNWSNRFFKRKINAAEVGVQQTTSTHSVQISLTG